jgi:CheY-like chemotaxis protein
MGKKIESAPEPETDRKPVALVVEDEILVRSVIAAYLRDVGFIVVEAGTGSEARQLLAVHNEIEIVFSDIRMPDGDGLALADWIGLHCEGVQVLLTSGEPDARLKVGPRPFIPKPYVFLQVEKRLRELLAKTDAHVSMLPTTGRITGVN